MALHDELAAVGDPKPPAQVSVGLPPSSCCARPTSPSRSASSRRRRRSGSHPRPLPALLHLGVADLQRPPFVRVLRLAEPPPSFGPSISWPIFEGGRIRANIACRPPRSRSYWGVLGRRAAAFQDVGGALVGFSHEQATRAQLEDAVRANERAADLARRAYSQGLTDFSPSWSPSNRCSPRRTHSRRASATSRSSWLRSTRPWAAAGRRRDDLAGVSRDRALMRLTLVWSSAAQR